jgi:hypothetical protein
VRRWRGPDGGGGASARREPNDGQAGDQRFAGVDPTAVREAVSEDGKIVEAWRWCRRGVVEEQARG